MSRSIQVTGRNILGNLPGTIAKHNIFVVETLPSSVETIFGLAGKLVSGEFVLIEASDAETVVSGVFTRGVAQASSYLNQGDTNPANTDVSLLTEGIITVEVQKDNASVAIGGAVYVRVANPTASLLLGGFEGATSVDTVTLPTTYAQWKTLPRALGTKYVAEITIKQRRI
jgi:hypothetical protein